MNGNQQAIQTLIISCLVKIKFKEYVVVSCKTEDPITLSLNKNSDTAFYMILYCITFLMH